MAQFIIYPQDSQSGYIQSADAVYANARAGTGTVTAFPNLAPRVGQETSYNVYQGFLSFDTLGIRNSSSTFLEGFGSTNNSTTDFTIEARLYDWGSTLVAADFVPGVNLAALPLAATFATTSFGSFYCSFTDVAIAANINPGGFTRFVLGSDRQRLNTTPTGAEWVDFLKQSSSGWRLTVTPDPPAPGTISYPQVLASATGSNNGAGATSITVSIPASTNGDLLVCCITVRGTATTCTNASWNLFSPDLSRSDGTNSKTYFFWRVAASEPGSYVFTLGASVCASAVVVEVSGCVADGSVVAAGSQANASNTTVAAPAKTSGLHSIGLLFGGTAIQTGVSSYTFPVTGSPQYSALSSAASTGASATTTAVGYAYNTPVISDGGASIVMSAAATNVGAVLYFAPLPFVVEEQDSNSVLSRTPVPYNRGVTVDFDDFSTGGGGGTKLYLHSAANALSGTFPTGEQSTNTPDWTAAGGATLRTADTIIGVAQTSLPGTSVATVSLQRGFLGFFCSQQLSGSGTLGGGAINLFCADKEQNTNAQFFINSVTAYIWRPGSGTQVGVILDPTTSQGGSSNIDIVERVDKFTVASSTGVAYQDGDVVIVEIWSFHTQLAATAWTCTFYYDGATDTGAQGSLNANAGSYVEFAETVTFGGGGGPPDPVPGPAGSEPGGWYSVVRF